MLATLVKEPFDDPNWLFEIKWDGYRALAFIDRNKIQLKSRNDHILNEQFSPIIEELKAIQTGTIFDGELVILDEQGRSDFQLMQNYQRNREGELAYYVFDLLFKDGEDLRSLPLIQRKEMLKRLLQAHPFSHVRLSDYISSRGVEFFKVAAKAGLEGIVGKKNSSTYQSRRTRDWVKIKTIHRQEFVIGGFTAPRASRKKFGALLIGFYDDKKELIYAGHVGGGFNETLLEVVYDQIKPLIQKKCPFKNPPKPNTPATWIKPKLVCEVSFSEWTNEDILRQPIFRGMRTDKSPTSVRKETPSELSGEKGDKMKNDDAKDSEQLIHSEKVKATHLEKVFWPKEKFTKGDLLLYYQDIAEYILPYLRDRPITLYRFPNGIENKGFYQKNITSHPDWISTYRIEDGNGKVDHFLQIKDLDSLLYAINLGSIDLHPFLSRYHSLDKPDFCVIDLDPHDIDFSAVIQAAKLIHEILQKAEVPHFCKTSGGKGLHILIPFQAQYDYMQSQRFAELICNFVHDEMKETTSLERMTGKRPNKIYLDTLQNRKGQSIVAPYSIRPRPGVIVSTPLHWEELDEKLDIRKFNADTVRRRLKEHGDILKNIFSASFNLNSALRNLMRVGPA